MKKYVFGLGSLLLAAVLFAFTPSPKVEKASLTEGYFERVTGDGSEPEHYQFVSEEAPTDLCSNGNTICIIRATIDQMGSANPSLWQPDFSAGNPVDDELEFNYVTKRTL